MRSNSLGPLVKLFHRLAKLFSPIPSRLIEPYRRAPVKHADETGWRNDGQSGYVWLFATDKISLFLFRKSRSSSVPREVFGDKPLPGTLSDSVLLCSSASGSGGDEERILRSR